LSVFAWSDADVRGALGLEGGGPEGPVFPRVSTDTRSVAPGDLFVALRGERFDAHAFLATAAEAGAAGAVVERVPDDAPEGLVYYRVADTLEALGRLARHRRRRLGARVVGVVGSNGKTTTKELIHAALAPRFRTYATQGNLNNQVGAPLTLLGVPDDAEAVVVEMGTNRPGEIEILTRIVEPEAGVVTSIGEEHLELLGDLQGVLEEEVALLAGLGPGGVAFVAEEPDALPERSRELLGEERVRVAGLGPDAHLRPDGGEEGIEVLPDGSTRWRWRGIEVHLPIPGRFHVRNALLALGLAVEWGVDPRAAVEGIGAVKLPKLRGQWVHVGGVRVLADCYNSNPPSVRGAIDLLASLPAEGRKIVVLGTMRELGAEASRLHRESAEHVAARVGQGVDLVVATGDFGPAFEPLAAGLGDRLVIRSDPIEAYDAVAAGLRGTETILLKASRGEELERWIPLLERDRGATDRS
jgi:UDP-N-acetylmuramoyl-tripeptide--D-alanyl-D-alanine ligase